MVCKRACCEFPSGMNETVLERVWEEKWRIWTQQHIQHRRLAHFSRASLLMYWQAGPCASSVTTSETAQFPWIPDQVASGALHGSSPVCFGSASNRPGSTGDTAALPRSASSGACPLALPKLFVSGSPFSVCVDPGASPWACQLT